MLKTLWKEEKAYERYKFCQGYGNRSDYGLCYRNGCFRSCQEAPEEKYGQQQQNLAKEEEALMKQRDNAAMDLEKKLGETQKDLQKKIDEYLVKIAEEKGYDFVLMKGAGGGVMFGRKALDITEATLNQLNADYDASKNKK